MKCEICGKQIDGLSVECTTCQRRTCPDCERWNECKECNPNDIIPLRKPFTDKGITTARALLKEKEPDKANNELPHPEPQATQTIKETVEIQCPNCKISGTRHDLGWCEIYNKCGACCDCGDYET